MHPSPGHVNIYSSCNGLLLEYFINALFTFLIIDDLLLLLAHLKGPFTLIFIDDLLIFIAANLVT